MAVSFKGLGGWWHYPEKVIEEPGKTGNDARWKVN